MTTPTTPNPHAAILLALRLRGFAALNNYLSAIPDADLRDVIHDLLDTAARETVATERVEKAARYLEGTAA